jgi:hypothetical protein
MQAMYLPRVAATLAAASLELGVLQLVAAARRDEAQAPQAQALVAGPRNPQAAQARMRARQGKAAQGKQAATQQAQAANRQSHLSTKKTQASRPDRESEG